ncbi:MAG: type II secretion system GspH family protein [Actinomycetota bacterium]|nr:type II secretion system GspH family protein [Actinomycetota bacterium]
MSSTEATPRGTLENGFSLLEVVVAMFLLALLSVAFAPVLIGALKTSAENSTLATGTQLLGRETDSLRVTPAYCDDISAFVAEPVPAVTDDRGHTYQPARTAGACPARYPGLVRVTLSVTATGLPAGALQATTLVYVQAASEPTS